MEERDETRKVDGLLRELSVEKGEVEGLGWNGRQKSHLERVFYERLVFVISSEGNGKP